MSRCINRCRSRVTSTTYPNNLIGVISACLFIRYISQYSTVIKFILERLVTRKLGGQHTSAIAKTVVNIAYTKQ